MTLIARRIRLSIPAEGKFADILFHHTISDSRILHYVLCEIDPGDHFTVEFFNTYLPEWGNAPHVHRENDGVHGYSWREIGSDDCTFPAHN